MGVTERSLFWVSRFRAISVPLFSGFVISLGFLACTKHSNGLTSEAPLLEGQALVQRGRVVYQTQCTACHNANPHKPGALGPDVYGSSKELLEARILRGAYPPGYTPKRETHVMAALPHLKNEIVAIHAYLNAPDELR